MTVSRITRRLRLGLGLCVLLATTLGGATSVSASPEAVTSTAWAHIPIAGLPGGMYQHIPAVVVYRGQLYIGVQTGGPSQIWRSTDGLNWTGVITGTDFGTNPLGTSVMDFSVVGDALYAATFTSGWSGAIWRTVDGDVWEPVRPNAYPSVWYFDLASFQDRLYVHAHNGEILIDPPSDEVLTTTNGTDWDVALQPDFAITSLSSVSGWLYVGGRRPSDSSACLWRFDGAVWEDVSADFQVATNPRVQAVLSFNGSLYAATTEDGSSGRTVVGLWRSFDGRDWSPVTASDVDLIRASGDYVRQISLVTYRGALYLFANDLGTGDVWRSADGEHWESLTPAEWVAGQSRGVTRAGAAVFNDRLWAGTVTIGVADDVLLYLPERLTLPTILGFHHE